MDHQLERLKRQAQRTANRDNARVGLFNLNRIGGALYVIRPADSFAGEDRLVAAFEPQPDCIGRFALPGED